ncbi:hypothetical protein ANCCEY_01500 [Ancylostoma ceylanicum]|uniref:Uncharacterized protein n=1 Tax=Ancylostoma ceylanicum TaxID=53326 RepID=A0A0D6M5R1_9BILA|nr:hypothetical protein ANCCEY_01500 [Ancylostoma ceylanicum]
MKKDTELDELLENCPVEMIPFAEHIRFSDPYDWEKNTTVSRESAAPSTTLMQSEERKTASLNSSDMLLQSKKQVANLTVFVLFPLQQTPQSGILKLYKRSAFRDVPRKDPDNPFPAEFFSHDPLGF